MTGARRDPPDLDAVRAFHRKFVTVHRGDDGDAGDELAVEGPDSVGVRRVAPGPGHSIS